MYIDEAGCPGTLTSAHCDIQPVLVLSGLIVEERNINSLNKEFLELKRKFSPNIALKHDLDIIFHEMKGSDLKKDLREKNRNKRRRAKGFLNKVLDILEKYDVKLVSRIYIKKPATEFNGISVYTSAVQKFYESFNEYLHERDDVGVVIADSRNYALNRLVSHSIFTQKNKLSRFGDAYPYIAEVPLFGHSENHSMIQIADFICSALLFPMASYVYCTNYIQNVHVTVKDKEIQNDFIDRIKGISYRYMLHEKMKGGIVVVDAISKRSSTLMLKKTEVIYKGIEKSKVDVSVLHTTACTLEVSPSI